MNIFNSLISEFNSLVNEHNNTVRNYDSSQLWTDVGYSQVIMQRDTAFELDGIGCSFVTSDNISDGVTVLGNDLNKINSKAKYARVTVVQIEDEIQSQQLYDLIKKIEYVKYHCFPDGFMVRSATSSFKENVRVSLNSVKNNVNFFTIGNLFIKKYKEIPQVTAVHIYFITEDSFDFLSLKNMAQKKKEITETLNKVMNDLTFDCSTCNLKPICDEVEGMKELHFNSVKMRG